ncbi:MAG: hypothetical protein AB8B95_09635 [Pseudohongiellaceae bacterium]
MSKKSRKTDRGTYALCTTIGLFAGIGLAPMINSGLYPAFMGASLGFAVAYYLVRRSHTKGHRTKTSHS